jgi:CRISPR-associated protein Csm1
MSKITRYQLYLSALLHDIGKFYQRADQGSSKSSVILSQSVKDAEQYFCPEHTSKKYTTHKHVLWTAQFFQDQEAIFRELLGHEYVSELRGGDTLAQLASAHHKPSSRLEKLIQLADWCASGVDRTQKEGQEDGAAAERSWDAFKKVRMRSVFESIHRETEKIPTLTYSLPLDAGSMREPSFPKKDESFEGSPDYAALWDTFVQEFRLLQPKGTKAFADSLLFLLEKYTSRIPSSTMHLPDVSLYHHLKSTAALACCLYDYEEETGLNVRENQEKDAFLLIGADLSGIQSYIYDIVSSYASKNLKGRSFWLQLLLDAVLERMLQALGLFRAHVVYASGGGFFLLAPNTSHVRETLKNLEQELQEKLFATYRDKLYLAIAAEPHSAQDLLNQNLTSVWKGLMNKLNEKKRQRFSNILVDQYGKFFEPDPLDALPDRDQITGEGLREEDEINLIHPDTNEQIKLGETLKKADYWVSSTEELSHLGQAFEPADLGVFHYLLSADKLAAKRDALKGSLDQALVRKINADDFLENSIAGNNNVYGFCTYGGNDFPTEEDGSSKTFNALAGRPDEEDQASEQIAYARLGVLRMDVDNLGQIFINGLSEERRTYSRYSSLSSNLDSFFKGYLNSLWEKDKYRDLTQIIYSGGDDLFIVGRWHLMIDLAAEIQAEFKRWVCHNEGLSISAGVAIIPPKYPISKGAELAAEEEKRAKAHAYHLTEDKKLEKNAISFMGIALHWEHEFPLVRDLKDRLKRWIMAYNMPKSILGRIHTHHQAYDSASENKTTHRWRWVMAYDFARVSERIKSPEIRQEVDEIKNAVFTDRWDDHDLIGQNTNHNMLQLLHVAARWAELEMRSGVQISK